MIEEIFAKHAADTSEFIIVFNKIDKINKTELISRLAVFQTYTKSPKAGGLGCERVSAFFMVSVKNNDGVDDVRKYIAGRLGNQMKLGDSLDARDQLNGVNTVTTREERTFEKTKTSTFKPAKVTTDNEAAALVSELVREQIFQQLHQELPYSLKVEHVFLERQSNVEHFFQDIIVPKHSQKIIVIGHNGETLKSIGHRARLNIERALKRRVYLHLFVKVAKEKDDGKSALSHKNPLNIANHS
jgi:GTPase Era involved in 16S rRNA processing